MSAFSAVTERVSPQAQGQYSVIQEQPSDGRCSSCQTQVINESQSLSYAGQACMKLQVADTGTNIFASSICHCNIITLVHVKMLLVGIIGLFFDVEIVLARSGGLKDMEVVNMKPLRFWSRCDRAGCTTCQKLDECRRVSSCLELVLATTFSRDEKFKTSPPG